MATLYEITDNLKLIQSLIEDGADEEVFADAIAKNEMDLAEKLEGYAMVMKNIESDIDGFKAEEKRLSERRKAMESKIKRMKVSMHDAMSSTGEKKIQGEKFTFTVQKNPPKTNITNESLLTEDLFMVETVRKPNNQLISERLKSGEVIPGAELSQGESLRIR